MNNPGLFIISFIIVATFFSSFSGVCLCGNHEKSEIDCWVAKPVRAGRTRVVFDYSVSSSFDLSKGRKVSTYKGSFFFRRTCFSKDLLPLFDTCRFTLVPVIYSSVYPLEKYESFSDVAYLITKGLRENKKVRSRAKYLKSGIAFTSESDMQGYRFIVFHKNRYLYAVTINSVMGDIVNFEYFELIR